MGNLPKQLFLRGSSIIRLPIFRHTYALVYLVTTCTQH